MESTIKILNNASSELEVDLYGGAFTRFQLKDSKINPLSFRFTKEQMPENNKDGAPYQGHFLCLGRWGSPSEGEKRAGLPDHGEFANIRWIKRKQEVFHLEMEAHGKLEGFLVKRAIWLDPLSAVYLVQEEVTNTQPLSRLYNMVQHPTLAGPFLDSFTLINCNAGVAVGPHTGNGEMAHLCSWPLGILQSGKAIPVNTASLPHTYVCSFRVREREAFGWITAYSPTHHLVLGYLWKRSDYPWIILWQDGTEGSPRYKGIEFGTTGIHKTFGQMVAEDKGELLGERLFECLDAGAKISRRFLSFQCRVPPGFRGVATVIYSKGCWILREQQGGRSIPIPASFDFENL